MRRSAGNYAMVCQALLIGAASTFPVVASSAPVGDGSAARHGDKSATEMRVLGLVGGTSWRSTVECYSYINQSVNDVFGDNTNPPLVIYSINQARINALQLEDRWDDIAKILSSAVLRLKAAGAEAVMFCANTPYRVYEEVSKATNVPILHIADATGTAIQASGLKRVGLLGTRYTMEGTFIPEWLREHYGVTTLVPTSEAARYELQRIIQKELSVGIFKPESKRYVLERISELEKRGAEGVILGCTEFPLIIGAADARIPLFDTTRLQAQQAVDFILGRLSPDRREAR